MKLIIVRHAPAEDRSEFSRSGRSDAERPLTAEGRKKMRRAANGLAEVVARLELVISSPLRRARQTAEILLRSFPKAKGDVAESLAPGAEPEALVEWLARRREGVIALVGHEPHLSLLIAFLCAGRKEPFTALKKGQACLLEFAAAPRRGGAALLWSLEPGQLRRLGR